MSGFSKVFALPLLLALALVVAQWAAVITHAQPLQSPSESVALAEPGPTVFQAFNLLMDRFVTPPNSADVLGGGWEGAVAVLRENGVHDITGGTPDFSNQRAGDWRAFENSYARLAEAAVGKLDKLELDRAIVRGMAASLHEGHTYYMTPEEYVQAQSQLRNDVRYGGIGARFNRDLVVIEVFESSPAQSGGLRPGDQLVAVDGKSVEGSTPAQASEKVRGEPSTPVELTIRRAGASDTVVMTLVRAEIRVDWLSHRILDNQIGYLLLRTFPTPDAMGAFRNAVERLEEANVSALIIDVRGNGGGSIETGIQIASRFIREGALFQRVDRRGGERTVTTSGGYWDRDIPIALLADGGSGSMSEILAAAMQENGAAQVVGTKTAGNVAGTNFHTLSDGSGLAITSLVIKTGQGKDLNGVGLEPDLKIELDPQLLRSGRDNQLDTALNYLRAEVSARAPRVGQRGGPRPALSRQALPLAA